MRDDEKVFRWGIGLLAAMFVIGATLQVFSRAQNRQLARVNAGIVKAQQEIALASTQFSAMLRPDVLRGQVSAMFPNFESIGFKKNINISDIPIVE